jgi:tetratricopeptide (TPR) repeat protein
MPPVLVSLVALALATASASAAPARSLAVVALDSEPKNGPQRPGPKELAALRHDVDEHPDDRTKRVALVRGLLTARDLDGALREAQAWRAKDAYNLVAVRALGDVYMERGEKEEAERVYSAIIELLPSDVDAQRALATLLKQRGDLPAAKARLEAALQERPDDARLNFEPSLASRRCVVVLAEAQLDVRELLRRPGLGDADLVRQGDGRA